jgi:hypothetical protein
VLTYTPAAGAVIAVQYPSGLEVQGQTFRDQPNAIEFSDTLSSGTASQIEASGDQEGRVLTIEMPLQLEWGRTIIGNTNLRSEILAVLRWDILSSSEWVAARARVFFRLLELRMG